MSYLTDRRDAEELADLLKQFDELGNKFAEFSMRMPEVEGSIIRSVIGDANARAYIEILQPMIESFPDLDPDAQP